MINITYFSYDKIGLMIKYPMIKYETLPGIHHSDGKQYKGANNLKFLSMASTTGHTLATLSSMFQ
jgi:hypothetical protein